MAKNNLEILEDRRGKADVVDICLDVVRINSINPPGDERNLAVYCSNFLQKLGFEVNLLHHTETRASVLACLRGTGQAAGVMVCAHMDTVPLGSAAWQHDPLGGEVSDGKIWGRGTSDMKGGLAAALAAAKVLVESGARLKGNLWIALTAGEEADFLGAVEVAKHREVLPLQVLLIPEPSSNHIYLAQKGALWVEVVMQGKTAHGSMPDQGVNAVELMADFIHRFKSSAFPYSLHPLLDRPTSTVTMMNGGIKINVVPDESRLTIDIRTLPGQNHDLILGEIHALLESLEATAPGLSTRVSIINNRPAVATEMNNPIIQPMLDAASTVRGQPIPIGGVNYFTDSAVLSPELGVPMVICGPGHARLAHQTDEYVEINLLHEAVKIYTLAIMNYLTS